MLGEATFLYRYLVPGWLMEVGWCFNIEMLGVLYNSIEMVELEFLETWSVRCSNSIGRYHICFFRLGVLIL